MKITFDVDVERKKSIVNFEFAENEDSIFGYDAAREALGMMYTELCIKSFPNQDYVATDSAIYCTKLGFPTAGMPEKIVAEIKEMHLITTEIKSFFCNEALETLVQRKEIATRTEGILNKIYGVSDEQIERK